MVKKKITNIRLILVVLLIILSSLFTVIFYLFPVLKYSYSSSKVKTIYFAENITSAHSYLIEEFNRIYKGEIEVIPINLPHEKFTTNKRKELITKNLRNRTSRIDIYAIDVVWGERFIKWAEPLNKYFTAKEMDLILSEAKKYCYSDSLLYSVPFFIDIGILYYREDLLSENSNFEKILEKLNNGITWQDIINLEYSQSGYKYLFQADNYEGLMCNFLEITGRHTFITSNNGELKFNNNILEKLNLVHSLIYKRNIIPNCVTKFDENKTFSYALENDIPFFRGWPTGKKNTVLDEKQIPKLKHLKFAPLPKFNGEKSTSTIGGWNLIVSKNSKYKAESIKFIKFLLSESSQKYIWENNGYLPVLKKFYSDTSYLNKNPDLALFYELIKNGVFRIKHSHYTKISDIVTANLNLYFRNKLSAEEFINNSVKEINNITNEYLINEKNELL